MTPILGILASSYPAIGDYESIATTTVGSGGQATISFTSIPSTYKHLQIRQMNFSNSAATSLRLQFNSDTGNNYSWHYISGDGASASAGAATSLNYGYVGYSGGINNSCVGVIDILDYKDTNKNKTVRSLFGYDVNGAGGFMNYFSSGWYNTAAITRIDLFTAATSFNQYSSFALYGIN
jgi:hypothetical protein